jgi:hypothetical protein
MLNDILLFIGSLGEPLFLPRFGFGPTLGIKLLPCFSSKPGECWIIIVLDCYIVKLSKKALEYVHVFGCFQ